MHSHLSLKSLKSIDVSNTQGIKTKATNSVKSLNHSAISNRLGSNTPQNRSSQNRSFCNDPTKSEHILYHKQAASSQNGTIAEVDYLQETNETVSNTAD